MPVIRENIGVDPVKLGSVLAAKPVPGEVIFREPSLVCGGNENHLGTDSVCGSAQAGDAASETVLSGRLGSESGDESSDGLDIRVDTWCNSVDTSEVEGSQPSEPALTIRCVTRFFGIVGSCKPVCLACKV